MLSKCPLLLALSDAGCCWSHKCLDCKWFASHRTVYICVYLYFHLYVLEFAFVFASQLTYFNYMCIYIYIC